MTPNTFAGLKTPFFFNVSTAMGRVLLTGLVMIRTNAVGHVSAIAEARFWITPALMLNRSTTEYVSTFFHL